MKKLTALLLALVMVLSVTACASNNTSATTGAPKAADTTAAENKVDDSAFDGEIVFGLSTAVTGNFPLAGERTLQGVDLAVEEINAAGGVLGKKLTYIYEDDGNDATTAVNVVTKLLNEDVVAVIGPHTTGNTLAVQSLYAEAGMPFFSGGTGVKLENEMDNKYFHRIRPSDSICGAIAAKFAVENLGAKKVGVDYNNNDFGTGGRDVVVATLQELGVEYVEVAHNSGDTDMTTQLMNLQAAGVDAVILWTDDAEDVVTARQAYELGLDIPFITSAGVVMQQVLDQMEPEYVEGWYSATDFVPANDDPVVKTFVEAFNAKYGIDPELYASAYYGTVKALAAAIEIAGSTDHEAVNDALTQIKDLPAPTGTMTYGAHGNMIHSLVITQIHDLKPSVVSTVSMDPN
jgi:hypothetical protein